MGRQYIGDTKKLLYELVNIKWTWRPGVIDKLKTNEHIWSENHKLNWDEGKCTVKRTFMNAKNSSCVRCKANGYILSNKLV